MSERNTDTDEPISKPTAEWEYRNFLCRVYRLGDIKVLGYVRVGDEWTQVIETEDMTTDVLNKVESEVDQIIMNALGDGTTDYDWTLDDPIDPQPNIDPINPGPGPIDPNPDDDPLPPGPHYGPPEFDHTYIPYFQQHNDSGTATITILSKDPDELAGTNMNRLLSSIDDTISSASDSDRKI